MIIINIVVAAILVTVVAEVGNQSGYQRTTTFYHDFKARFGMPPAEYREQELKK